MKRKSAMKPIFFRTSAELRPWLKKNCNTARELLMGLHRKESAKGGITYSEALVEALCFGWIDGVRKRFDESSYTIRFTPRKPRSIWSALNIKRVGQLIELGRMEAVGQKVFDQCDQKKAKLYS
jgi:uncharacterized protein YdeI (YjbR/CyaY-like superfamily)